MDVEGENRWLCDVVRGGRSASNAERSFDTRWRDGQSHARPTTKATKIISVVMKANTSHPVVTELSVYRSLLTCRHHIPLSQVIFNGFIVRERTALKYSVLTLRNCQQKSRHGSTTVECTLQMAVFKRGRQHTGNK